MKQYIHCICIMYISPMGQFYFERQVQSYCAAAALLVCSLHCLWSRWDLGIGKMRCPLILELDCYKPVELVILL